MTLGCNVEQTKPKTSAAGFEQRERLLLSNLPMEGVDTYKRMLVYATLKLVETHPDISEGNITYTLNRFLGYSPTLVGSVLTSLTSRHIFPLLSWWKNPRLKRSKERFFVPRATNDDMRQNYIKYLESNFPDFKMIDFNNQKGIQ